MESKVVPDEYPVGFGEHDVVEFAAGNDHRFLDQGDRVRRQRPAKVLVVHRVRGGDHDAVVVAGCGIDDLCDVGP